MRKLIAVCMSSLIAGTLSGCALTPDDTGRSLVLGEHAAYRVVNLAGASVLEMPTLIEAGTGQILFSTLALASKNPQRPRSRPGSQEFEPSPAVLPVHMASAENQTAALMLPDVLGQDPGNENLSLPPASIEVSAVMPNGHKIPNSVELSWRRAPEPGQAVYLGEKQQAIKLALRERIPAWVISQIRDQWRYRLDLDVVVNGKNTAGLRWKVLCFNDGSLHEIARGGKWQ
jgi:hypothetical protein